MKRVGSLLVCAVAVVAVLGSCTNDPFDPSSLENERPVIRFFAEPVDPDAELSDTSYYSRSYHWSGSDVDGLVELYFVSIRGDAAVEAPWEATTRTDTTMTFVTDDAGEADVVFYLACRDDRGAMSDTLVRHVPVSNSRPVLNLQRDFEPLTNLQREFVDNGEAGIDTVYWNWGSMNLRCFAADLDGRATMDSFYYYHTADEDPPDTVAFTPDADPMLHWIEVLFEGAGEIVDFEIFVSGLPPGQRTLTVVTGDEAGAEARLPFSWEVRAPRGPVLVVPDNSGPATKEFYAGFCDQYFGAEAWDLYDFWFGFPDDPNILLKTLRKFECVLWFNGGGTSAVLEAAAERDGVLEEYVLAPDGSPAGRLMMISRSLVGTQSGLSPYFRQTMFGINPTGDPPNELQPTALALGLEALGAEPHLPTMVLDDRFGRGRGIQMRYDETDAYDELYRFEESVRVFSGQGNNVWAPLIAVRRPMRTAENNRADTVGVSFELHAMEQAGAYAALAAMFEHELQVTPW